MDTKAQVDDILESLGSWGRYQLITIAYIFLGMVTFAFTALGIVFTGFTPPHTCREISSNDSYFNNTVRNYNLTDYDVTYDQCSIDVRMNVTNSTEITINLPCINGYNFRSEGETIVTEWELVCDKAGRGELTQTLLIVGQFFGSLIFPSFSDRFGRKTVLVSAGFVLFCLLMSLSFVTSYIAFAVIRFFIGAFIEGFGLTSTIYMLELFPKDCRGRISAAGAVYWTFSVMLLAPFGYLLRNYSWRYFQITTALISTYGLAGYWFLDESLRWLVANGKTDSALKVVKRAARWNKVNPDKPVNILLQTKDNIPENEFSDLVATDKKASHIEETENTEANMATEATKIERYNILTIVKHRIVLKFSVILWITWTTNSLTYYGLTLTSSTLAGNRFLNYFLVTAAEFPGAICYLFLVDRKGRKFSSILFHAIAGVSLIISVVLLLVEDATGSLKIVSSVFSLLGKFGIASSFNVIFLYTPEMYPTNLRNVGIGMASSAAKFGGMVAPYSMILASKAVWAPGVMFGGLCLLVTVLTKLLPETKGHELPQFIEELKVWYKSQKGNNTKKFSLKSDNDNKKQQCSNNQ